MNTMQELLDNNIDLYTATMMLNEYSKRIGTMNGVYKIIDINYDFNIRGKIVTLECQECGEVIYRTMINGRNKWSELIRSCECQKAKKEYAKKAESEKISKMKKDQMVKDAYSMVGTNYGEDYKIVSVGRDKEKLILALECKTCGEVISAPYQSIKDNAKKYRKCTKHYTPIKFDESYIGQKKNFLKVIGITRLPNKHRAFLCECDCGNTTTIEPAFWEQGIVKSCGCFAESFKLEHSEELDRLRRIHNGMMQRCYNPNSNAYKHYGGRGIIICPEWHDREVFIDWALNHSNYSNDLSIDRIDVNGNYEPNNCRWATAKEQANNQRPRTKGFKRKLKTVIIDGVERPIVEWNSIYGVTGSAVAYRMKTYGMSFEDALKFKKYSTKESSLELRLNETMRNHIEETAKSKSVSMSEYIRQLIKNDMRNK